MPCHTPCRAGIRILGAGIRVAAALAAALALAACGSAGGATGTQTAGTQNAGSQNANTQAAARTATVTTTTITSTAPPTSAPAASSPSGRPECRAAGLALRFLGQQGATGHGELGFAVRNTGSARCRIFGYPGVQFLDASGAGLPTRSQRVSDDFVGPVPPVEIVLAPGASASFRLVVTHGNASPAGCTIARGLQVYPPDDTATLTTAIPEGASECGTATVSPMRPGVSAYR